MNRHARVGLAAIAVAYFLYYLGTYTEWHFIDNVNLIFHEAGHFIFGFFGMFIRIAMGSGFQILLPLFISGYFYFHGQRVSSAIALMWAGQNVLNVSIYAGDAQALLLPILGGDSVVHDWNWLLSTTHLLGYTDQISHGMYLLGAAVVLAGAALSLWSAWKYEALIDTRFE